MKEKFLITVVLGLFITGVAPIVLCAQSATTMDTILEQEDLSFGAASYLLLVARGDLKDNADFGEAAEKMAEVQPYFSDKDAGDTLNLGEYSFLLMKMYNLGGGLMYSVLPGPRYAVRELAFIDIVQGGTYPKSPLSGERAVRILERYLTVSGKSTPGGEI